MNGNIKKINNKPAEEEIEKVKKLINSNQITNAENSARELSKKYPDSIPVLNILGVSLIAQEKFSEAEKIYLKILNINPNFAEGYNNIANIYMKQNNNDKAIYYFEKALFNKPNLTQACFNLAKIYTKLGDELQINGKINDSIKNYKRAIKNKPDYVDGYNNLGISLQKLNRITEAKNTFEKAIKIKPDYFLSHNNLGNIFLSLGENVDAVKSYQKAIKLNFNCYEAHSNLGIALNFLGKFDESISHYEKAIKINPNFEQAYNNLAVSKVNQGQSDEAKILYNKAFKLNPKKTQYAINANLILPIISNSKEDIKFHRNKYDSSIDLIKKYKYSIKDPQNEINPSTFYLSYSEFDNLKIIKKTSTFFREAIPLINYNSEKNSKLSLNVEKNYKIKLGFISEFFTDHSIGKLYRGLIKKIDKNKFDVTVIHAPKTKQGKIKNEIDSYTNNIVNLNGKIDNQQKQIEEQFLDIIFYPDIGMSASTYFLAHARLAPIQVISWGHPETSGINTIDYFLSSSFIESDDSNIFYSEKLINLNRIPMFFIPPDLPSIELFRSDFQLSENKNLYCCPQSLFKIHPDFDEALDKIVNGDKDSLILMIESKYKNLKEKLKNRWSKNHPKLNEKVVFLKRMSQENFLSLIKVSDVLLDPFYFGAGVSFNESMIVGTPTVTMPGKFMRSRVVAGCYKQMKIKNPPIAKNIGHYVDIAIDLAKNKKGNNQLRKILIKAAKVNLFSDMQAVKEFENFFEKVCEKY